MCLVHDDRRVIILRKLTEASFLTEGLHGADGNREHAAKGGGAGLLIGTVDAGHLLKLVRSLIQQFTAMRHDQHPAATVHAILRHL